LDSVLVRVPEFGQRGHRWLRPSSEMGYPDGCVARSAASSRHRVERRRRSRRSPFERAITQGLSDRIRRRRADRHSSCSVCLASNQSDGRIYDMLARWLAVYLTTNFDSRSATPSQFGQATRRIPIAATTWACWYPSSPGGDKTPRTDTRRRLC